MKKILLCIVGSLIFFSISPTHALAAPALVLNFASINELDWAAPEDKWQSEILPKIEKEVLSMRGTLTADRQSPSTPVLGWSTLIEYMNYPMDTPCPTAPYVIKVRRILQIAEKNNFPVFLPLNGFQWWDELPELYNYWDSDGTHTDPRFFARQENPTEFKKRFIAAYNPGNVWNVEWQSKKTPMRLNFRNWGSGGFVLAPPPNIFEHENARLTYRDVQRLRLRAILQMIRTELDRWTSAQKEHLFLGVSIGTEVSLNASATVKDEFAPYGYRSTQDLQEGKSGFEKMTNARNEVVRSYLEDNARLATLFGIQKDLIYTHVLGEQDATDPHFGGIAAAAFNLYSTPGVSLYGYAKNPTQSKNWMKVLSDVGSPTWGILEYNAGDLAIDWKNGLAQALQHARVTIIYNWDGLSKNAIEPIKHAVQTPIQKTDCVASNTAVIIVKGPIATLDSPALDPTKLSYGLHTRYTKTVCGDKTTIYGQPEVFSVTPNIKI